MTYTEYTAVVKFAERLKNNLPIALNPKSYNDEILNATKQYAIRIIDMTLENATDEFNEESNRMAVHYGK